MAHRWPRVAETGGGVLTTRNTFPMKYRLLVLREKFWHWAKCFTARAHYIASRQAADANLAEINAHKKDVIP